MIFSKKKLQARNSKVAIKINTKYHIYTYFNRAKQHYQEALVKGVHKHDLKYNAGNDKKTKNILYSTPPFCLSVETKIGKRLLEIFSRNFD